MILSIAWTHFESTRAIKTIWTIIRKPGLKSERKVFCSTTLSLAHIVSQGICIWERWSLRRLKPSLAVVLNHEFSAMAWVEQVGHRTFLIGLRLFKLREEYSGSSFKPGFPIIVRIVSIAPVVPKTFETIGATHCFPYNHLDPLSARSSTKITGSDIITLLKCIEFWENDEWLERFWLPRSSENGFHISRSPRNRPDRLHFYPDDCDRPNRPASRHRRFHVIVSITWTYFWIDPDDKTETRLYLSLDVIPRDHWSRWNLCIQVTQANWRILFRNRKL